MNKNIIIVARHFPPLVSGGARRPYLLAQALQARGHRICVITPAQTDRFPAITVPHPCPESLHGQAEHPPTLKGRLREWLLLPDPDIRWARRAARVELPFTPDWIITTSPPESIHAAGRLLKKRTGALWLADFRDHWLDHPLMDIRRRSTVRRFFERMLAKFILHHADHVSTVSRSIQGEIVKYLPANQQGRVDVVANTAPPLPEKSAPKPTAFGPGLNLVHTGAFSLSDRNRSLRPVLSALEQAGRSDLTLHLVGKLTAEELDSVRQSAVRNHINVSGGVSLEESWRYQMHADALLLAVSDGTPHIPGKLAEYRRTGKPIVVSGKAEWMEEMGVDPNANLVESLKSLQANSPTVEAPPTSDVQDALKAVIQLVEKTAV